MRTGFVVLALLASSTIAGLVGLAIVNRWHPLVPLPEELAMQVQPTQEQLDTKIAHERWNDSYALAVFSALTLISGTPLLFMGSNSIARSGAVALAGLVLGGALGVGVAWLGFYCQDWLPITLDVLIRVALRWMVMLIPIGLVGGLLYVAAQGGSHAASVSLGGAVGGILAAVLYCLLVATFLQTENTDSVMPASPNGRMLLFLMSPLLIWSLIASQRGNAQTAAVPQDEPIAG